MTRPNEIVRTVILGCFLILLQWSPSAASENFLQAIHPRVFEFPADHGDHPGFQTEWWYYTGNLVSEGNRAFGYQLTFFRVQLKPEPVRSGSPWRSNQVYFAHFTLSDMDAGAFLTAEEAGRGTMGIAGVASDKERIRVFLHGWESSIRGKSHRLTADSGRFEISLELVSQKPPVLHGDRGLSRKGGGAGQASYYYTLTRMNCRGVLRLDGQRFMVAGTSWMDHEFTSNVLSKDQTGWDWMGLQLSGNRELMLYVLRRSDGSIDPFSSGTLVNPDGTSIHLSKEAFRMRPTGFWHSKKSGARYPSGWQVDVFPFGMSLRVTPNLEDQELITRESTQVTYWEGSVAVAGEAEGERLTGSGYAELTGYAGEFKLRFEQE